MNSIFSGVLATAGFELRRSFTFQRTSVSVILALFPPLMLSLLIFGSMVAESKISSSQAAQVSASVQDVSRLLTILMVAMVCLLSLMLWATPNISSELEGKSWSFIASRPGGRISVFLGKFLASFAVAFSISMIAVTLCVVISNRMFGIADASRLWLAMGGVFFAACLVYSAVFSMIGTIFIKRAMVVAAGYIIGSDIVLASIPGALINKFTLRYHLQELGIRWVGWFMPGTAESEYRQVFGTGWSTWLHISVLVAIMSLALSIGCWVIVNREYVISDES
jgi:ABC-type transport system involved in multi-copper enzyme maturation permease subunit